jgi:hypothetical protein
MGQMVQADLALPETPEYQVRLVVLEVQVVVEE